jgi:hypothetical protein
MSESTDVSIQQYITISASNQNDLPFNFGDIKVANTNFLKVQNEAAT